jgi:hypothetical protein
LEGIPSNGNAAVAVASKPRVLLDLATTEEVVGLSGRNIGLKSLFEGASTTITTNKGFGHHGALVEGSFVEASEFSSAYQFLLEIDSEVPECDIGVSLIQMKDGGSVDDYKFFRSSASLTGTQSGPLYPNVFAERTHVEYAAGLKYSNDGSTPAVDLATSTYRSLDAVAYESQICFTTTISTTTISTTSISITPGTPPTRIILNDVEASTDASTSLDQGAIAGIVIGSLIFLCIILCCIHYFFCDCYLCKEKDDHESAFAPGIGSGGNVTHHFNAPRGSITLVQPDHDNDDPWGLAGGDDESIMALKPVQVTSFGIDMSHAPTGDEDLLVGKRAFDEQPAVDLEDEFALQLASFEAAHKGDELADVWGVEHEELQLEGIHHVWGIDHPTEDHHESTSDPSHTLHSADPLHEETNVDQTYSKMTESNMASIQRRVSASFLESPASSGYAMAAAGGPTSANRQMWSSDSEDEGDTIIEAAVNVGYALAASAPVGAELDAAHPIHNAYAMAASRANEQEPDVVEPEEAYGMAEDAPSEFEMPFGWLHPVMSNIDAEAMLDSAAEGTFVLRDYKRAKGFFVISVMNEAHVTHHMYNAREGLIDDIITVSNKGIEPVVEQLKIPSSSWSTLLLEHVPAFSPDVNNPYAMASAVLTTDDHDLDHAINKSYAMASAAQGDRVEADLKGLLEIPTMPAFWVHPKMENEDAEDLLAGSSEGTFIVRDYKNQKGFFVFTVMHDKHVTHHLYNSLEGLVDESINVSKDGLEAVVAQLKIPCGNWATPLENHIPVSFPNVNSPYAMAVAGEVEGEHDTAYHMASVGGQDFMDDVHHDPDHPMHEAYAAAATPDSDEVDEHADRLYHQPNFWVHPKMANGEAEEILHFEAEGTFLVRDYKQEKGFFVISVVNEGHVSHHMYNADEGLVDATITVAKTGLEAVVEQLRIPTNSWMTPLDVHIPASVANSNYCMAQAGPVDGENDHPSHAEDHEMLQGHEVPDGWVHPKMKNKEAEDQLEYAPEGTFMIRDYKKETGFFVISVVNEDHTSHHLYNAFDGVVDQNIRVSKDGLEAVIAQLAIPSGAWATPLLINWKYHIPTEAPTASTERPAVTAGYAMARAGGVQSAIGSGGDANKPGYAMAASGGDDNNDLDANLASLEPDGGNDLDAHLAQQLVRAESPPQVAAPAPAQPNGAVAQLPAHVAKQHQDELDAHLQSIEEDEDFIGYGIKGLKAKSKAKAKAKQKHKLKTVAAQMLHVGSLANAKAAEDGSAADLDDVEAMLHLKADGHEQERLEKVKIAIARARPVPMSRERVETLDAKALLTDDNHFVLNKALRRSVHITGEVCKHPGCSTPSFAGGKCMAHA